MDPERIARLTDYQLLYVYAWPRDKEGKLVRAFGPRLRETTCESFRDMYYSVWKERGLEEDEIDERWERYLEENPGLLLLQGGG